MQFTVSNDEFFYRSFFFWVNCYDDTLLLKLSEQSKQCSGADGIQIQVKQTLLCSHLHGYK